MKKSICSVVGSNIKVFRKKRRLTQEKLAGIIGVDYKYLQRMEGRNTPNLTIKTIEKIAQALKIKPSKLFEYRA